MQTIPVGTTDGMNDAERAIVEAWWSTLGDAEQRELETQWDARTDDTALHAVEVDGKTEWHELPIHLRGHFVDREAHREDFGAKRRRPSLDCGGARGGTPSQANEDAMWKQMLCEYINSHEVKLFLEMRTAPSLALTGTRTVDRASR